MAISKEDWNRIEAHIDSKVETGINDGLAQARHLCQISAFGEQELREMINGLGPAYKVTAGKSFLLKVLEAKGPAGLDRFMQKATSSLLDDGKLDWEDFDTFERNILKSAKPDVNRRWVLTRFAGVAGAGAIAKNIIKGVNREMQASAAPEKEATTEDSPLHRGVHTAAKGIEVIEPIIETGLGTIAVAYAVREYTTERLDQVTNAITKLARETRTDRLR